MPLFTSAVLSIFNAGCQACTVRLCSSLRQYISSRVRGAVTPAWNLGCPFSGEAALKLSDLTSLCASWGRGSLPPVRAGQPFDLDLLRTASTIRSVSLPNRVTLELLVIRDLTRKRESCQRPTPC